MDWKGKIVNSLFENDRMIWDVTKVRTDLANMGVDQNELFVIFESPPSLLIPNMLEDISGVAWPRLVNA